MNKVLVNGTAYLQNVQVDPIEFLNSLLAQHSLSHVVEWDCDGAAIVEDGYGGYGESYLYTPTDERLWTNIKDLIRTLEFKEK
jgi:hypothetical protein